jgi:hypothetical protein
MINGQTNKKIKSINDEIISGRRPSVSINAAIVSLDCFRQIDPSTPGLKKIEANMGRSIVESSVPFDLARPLDDKEVEETIKYCRYDVLSTIEVFKIRWSEYFVAKNMLLSEYPLQKGAYRWNTTTIATNILTKNKIARWGRPVLGEDQEKLIKMVPENVKDFWNHFKTAKPGDAVNVNNFGCDFTFSLGGIHGVNDDGKKRFQNVTFVDVESLYPHLALKLNVLGAESSKTYKSILEKRLAAKRAGNDVLSKSLKLIINSCYGLLRNQYSNLYNPIGALSLCIYGQIIIYDLSKRLYDAGCKLINVNTDGVGFQTANARYIDECKKWQDEYGLTLEEENFKIFVQKDVNNYIGVKENGEIKVKGKDVKRCQKSDIFRNNSLRIVDTALYEKIINNVEPIDTIINNLDKPELFMLVLQAGKTYNGTVDGEGKFYQKVNRVFAAREGVTLYKQRPDGGKVLYPNAPDNMLVFNESLEKFDKQNELDLNFYNELCQKVINRWL